MKANKLRMHEKLNRLSATSKKANFNRKAVLLDSKKSKSRKKKVSAKSARITKNFPKNPSVFKAMVHEHLSRAKQEKHAEELYNSYAQSEKNVNSSAYLMWSLGFLVPTAFEAAGAMLGFSLPDLRAYLLTNLLFAAAFRFSVGKEIVGHHHKAKRKKAATATQMLKSRQITSEKAEAMLASMSPAEEAYLLLSDGHVMSERAQLLLVDKFAVQFPVDKLRELTGSANLSAVAKARLDEIRKKKETNGRRK